MIFRREDFIMDMVTTASDKYEKCINECLKCSQICYKCFNSCLDMSNAIGRKDCIKALIACAHICEMSVSLMSMNSQFVHEHCSMCASICEKCAEECEMFRDDLSLECARECRSCAEELNQLTLNICR